MYFVEIYEHFKGGGGVRARMCASEKGDAKLTFSPLSKLDTVCTTTKCMLQIIRGQGVCSCFMSLNNSRTATIIKLV